MSEESSPNTHSHSVVDLVLTGSLLESLTCGGLAAIASALLGGVGARTGDQFGEFGLSLGGAVGTALAGACLPFVMVGSIKPWYRVVVWFLACLLFALALDWVIPRRLDWPVYRWVLGGTSFGILIGGFYEPIRLARGGQIEALGKGKLLVEIAETLASIVKLFNDQCVGSVVAGALGGAIGGVWTCGIVAAFGGKEAAEWLGSYLVIPLGGAFLGALGGGLGGSLAWRIAAGGKPEAVSEHKPAGEEGAEVNPAGDGGRV